HNPLLHILPRGATVTIAKRVQRRWHEWRIRRYETETLSANWFKKVAHRDLDIGQTGRLRVEGRATSGTFTHIHRKDAFCVGSGQRGMTSRAGTKVQRRLNPSADSGARQPAAVGPDEHDLVTRDHLPSRVREHRPGMV